MLKWRFRPDLRGISLKAKVELERFQLARHMAESPSLRSVMTSALEHAYEVAIIQASADLDREEALLRAERTWTYDQLCNPDFWPSDGQEAPRHREEA
jgi:hypothetical protein